MKTLGFIGLGVMGGPMARRLAESDHPLRVFDIDPARTRPFDDMPGVVVGNTPLDTARGVDYLFTMLPTSGHVRSALFGDDGAVAALANGAVVVEMSTGDPADTLDMAEALDARGLRMLDVPVGRTPVEAAAGTLLLIAGGDRDTIDELEPVLMLMGDELVRAGELGNGIKLKLVNNYMTMVGMVMTAETLMFAAKLGLDRDTMVHVLQNTAAGRGQINVNFPRKVLAGDISADFPLRLGLKDLSLSLDLGRSVGAPLSLGAASRELFSLAQPWGRSEQDCTAMLLLLEDLAKMEHQPLSSEATGAVE